MGGLGLGNDNTTKEMMTIGKMVELKTAERSNELNNLKVETKLHFFPQKHSQSHITFFKFPLYGYHVPPGNKT